MRRILLMIAALLSNFSASAADDDQYLKALSALLSEAVTSRYETARVDGASVLLRGRTVEFVPALEWQRRKSSQYLVGLRIEVLIDEVPMGHLTAGAVGIDETEENAIATAVSEWLTGYGFALLDLLAGRRAPLKLRGRDIYAGGTGFRGPSPGNWLDGGKSMHLRILEAIFNRAIIGEGELHSLSILVVKHENKAAQITCLVNTLESDPCKDAISDLPWAEGTDADFYMFKQAYLLASPEL